MNHWPEVKLDEVVDVTDYVANGSFASLKQNVSYSVSPDFAVLVRLVDFNNAWAGPFKYVDRHSYDFLKKSSLTVGDVVVANVGSVGNVFQVPDLGLPMTLGPNSVLCRPRDPCLYDRRFLYYFLSAPAGQSLIQSIVGGSAQPKFNKTGMRQLSIPIPAIAEQHAVADILEALDNKIASNRRLVNLQDEYFLASWSALTERTENVRTPLAELIQTPIAGDWGAADETAEQSHSVYCIRGADLTNLQRFSLGKTPSRFLKTKSLERREVHPGDIVVEMSGGSPTQSTGRAALITNSFLTRSSSPVVSSNFCKTLRPKNLLHACLLYAEIRTAWARGDFFQFENGTTGIKNLAFTEFASSRDISIPPEADLRAFSDLADALFDSMEAHSAESATLAELRDALLPELMSGRLRVKDAEKKIEEVV